jgi:Novel STAND NTPase 1
VADAQQRAELAGLLAVASTGPVSVVGTIRPEFLSHLLKDSTFTSVMLHPVAVRPLDSARLAEVITGPARRAGIAIDEQLVQRMVVDTGTGDGLPLLAYTLHELAENVRRAVSCPSPIMRSWERLPVLWCATATRP